MERIEAEIALLATFAKKGDKGGEDRTAKLDHYGRRLDHLKSWSLKA